MFKIILFVGFLSVLQLASCRGVPEPPAVDAITLNQLTTKAEEAYGNLHKNILKFANVNSDAELRDFVRTKSHKFADKLKTLSTELSSELKTNAAKFEGVWKPIVDSFNEKSNELKADNPALASLNDTIEKGIKAVLQQSQKLRARINSDGEEMSKNAEKIMKKIFEGTADAAKSISERLASAVKKV